MKPEFGDKSSGKKPKEERQVISPLLEERVLKISVIPYFGAVVDHEDFRGQVGVGPTPDKAIAAARALVAHKAAGRYIPTVEVNDVVS